MGDLAIICIFAAGVAFGVIATLIYWPWFEPKILPTPDDHACDLHRVMDGSCFICGKREART
jgi:hypothetical protein